MRRFLAGLCLGILMAPGAQAQQGRDMAEAMVGTDRFMAGGRVALTAEGVDDAFMAGRRVALRAALTGSAHLLGWRIAVSAPVGGDLYAAGFDIAIDAAVAGDVSATGDGIAISAPVGGDLRAAAEVVEIAADIAGTALVGAGTVRLDAAVSGDAVLAARYFTFGPGARVDGVLTIVSKDPEAVEVPERVAPPDRIRRVEAERMDRFTEERIPDAGDIARPALGALLGWTVMTALLVVLGWGVIPTRMDGWTGRLRDAPGLALLTGFLLMAVLIGGSVLAGLTVIGVVLIPLAMLAGALAVPLGFALGAQALGLRLWRAAGRERPAGVAGLAGLAAGGAVLAGVILLVPLVGWLFVMALVLAGIGALGGGLAGRLAA